MEEKKHIIISLGGSLIVPDEVDIEFLKRFTANIKDYVAKGFQFVIITGGGKVCRKYQHALTEILHPSGTELDWLGIYVTRLNAEFIKLSFGDLACPEIIMDPNIVPTTDKPIIIGGGWKPGWSTDYDAVVVARELGAKKIINLSNIDYAYDKDPKKFPDALKIEKTSWAEFRAILPKEWGPGLNAPFDPIAAEKAESLGLEVVIMNGHNIENLDNYLNGKDFIGSVIS